MGRKPNLDAFIPPEVAMFGNAFAIKWQNSVKNLRTYGNWWQLFYTAATSCFKWEGLPEEIDERFFEKMLFCAGSIAMTKRVPTSDNLPLWVAARFSQVGMPDIYNNPNRIRMIAPNGLQWDRHLNKFVGVDGIADADAVACWDNLQRMPLYSSIDVLCTRLAEFDSTIDLNLRAHRTPYIVTVPEEGKKNAQTMFNKVDAGEPAIYVNTLSTSAVGLQVFNSGVDYNVDKMLNDQLKLVAQAYTLLGIDNNAAAEKKERVQTAETMANNEQFMVQRESRYRARLQFADRCREVFGLDIKPMWSIPHVPEQDSEDLEYGNEHTSAYKPGVHSELFSRESGEGGEKANVDVL